MDVFHLFNAWYLTRSAAVISYILISLSVMTGVYAALRRKFGHTSKWANLLHTPLANWGMYLAMFHVAILFFDNYVQMDWRGIFIPFASSWERIPMGIGTIALYLLIVTVLLAELRTKIGQKIWRRLHMLSPLAYIGSTVHGLWSGTDSMSSGFFQMYVASAVGVLLLLFLRFFPGFKRTAAE